MTTIAELHSKSLALIEGKRLVDIQTAAKYLGRGPHHVYDLVKRQLIESVYDGPKRRMVVVASLIRYADRLPIDRPEVNR